MLTEANRRIALYGPMIQRLQWKDADCLMTNGGVQGVNVGEYLLNELKVKYSETIPLNTPQYYEGWVQCGYYKDELDLPSFMLVNRRAAFQNVEGEAVQTPVDGFFCDATPQVVRFQPSSSALTQFNTNRLAVYDPYDDSLWKMYGTNIDVVIGPGDGRLLEMVGTIPDIVTSNTELRYKACLSGDITISEYDTLSVAENTQLYILPNTRISLNSGSVFNIQGNVSIAENVRFTIYDDATLNIQNPENSIEKTIINAGNQLHFEVASGAVCNLSGLIDFKGIVEFCIADSATVNISDAICSFDSLYISGPGNFNIGNECECSFDFQSFTDITGGAKVEFSGTLNYLAQSRVIVSNQSSLSYLNAEISTTHLVNIKSSYSSVTFSGTSLTPLSTAVGDSIIIENLSLLTILDSTIKHAPITVSCSDLYVGGSDIYIRTNTTGVTVSNPYTSRSVTFCNDNDQHGFIGQDVTPSTKGIDITESQAPVIIRNTSFNNLG